MLIRESNQDVAITFGLSAQNGPKHLSLCTDAWIDADFQRGERYFIFHAGSAPVACVAFRVGQPKLYTVVGVTSEAQLQAGAYAKHAYQCAQNARFVR